MVIYSGFSHWKLWFSIVMLVMLNDQRVLVMSLWFRMKSLRRANSQGHLKSHKGVPSPTGNSKIQYASWALADHLFFLCIEFVHICPIGSFSPISVIYWDCWMLNDHSEAPHFQSPVNHPQSGWWFGTCFISPYIGNVIIPIDFHSNLFQRGRYTNHQPVLEVAKRVFACKYASQLMRRYQRIKNNQRRKLRIAQLDEVVEAKIREKLRVC